MATIRLSNGREVEALVTVGCDIDGNGGTALYDPSTYNGETATIVKTNTNSKGQVLINVVVEDVAKVSLQWKFLDAEKWSTILKLFDGTNGGNFVQLVKFFNQTTNKYEIREMYVGDRKSGIFMRNADGSVRGYTDCTLNLVDTRNRSLT